MISRKTSAWLGRIDISNNTEEILYKFFEHFDKILRLFRFFVYEDILTRILFKH